MSLVDREAFDFAFDFVQRCNALYCLRPHRVQVVLDQFIKLASSVGKTTRADTAFFVHDLVVATIAIADWVSRRWLTA